MCEEQKNCGNCLHRDYANEIIAPVKKSYGTVYEKLAPCLIQAVEPDAGDAVVYFSENGHCRYHLDAFMKSEDYIEQCDQAAELWGQAAC